MVKLKILIATIILSIAIDTYSQIIDLNESRSKESETAELLSIPTDDFLNQISTDIFTNGRVQLGLQVYKYTIGDEEAFHFPVYFFVSPSGKVFGSEKRNQNTVANILNPMGGVINISFAYGKNIPDNSESAFIIKPNLQIAGKTLYGQDSLNNESFPSFSLYGNLGLYLQARVTSAQTKSKGYIYLQGKLASSYMDNKTFKQYFGSNAESNLYLNFSIDFGVIIKDEIVIKGSYYNNLNNKEVELLNIDAKDGFKLSMDFNFDKVK